MMNILNRTLDDLLVHIKDMGEESDRYLVQIALEGERHYDGELTLADLPPPPEGDSLALAEYGIELFNHLFPGPLDDIFQQAWAAAHARQHGLRLRLWLDSSTPALHDIPWELLYYDASGGRGQPLPLAVDDHVAFSRFLNSDKWWGKPIEYRPLKLFLMVAAPHDLQEAWPGLVPIDKEAELRALRTPLEAMIDAGQITCNYEEALHSGTEEDLHAALEQDYDVILYFGHALHHPDRGTRLVLEDVETGNAELYDGAELVRRLRQSQKPPSLFILVACNTAAQQRAGLQHQGIQTSAPTSLAAQLVQNGGVPAVLAMQHLVDIELARTFSSHLSEYLVRYGVIDVAVNAVRNQVYEADSISWSTPVLYMRSRDGRLFAPNARLEYVHAIYHDTRFSRWQGADFIRLEAITVPQGQPWELFTFRPQDAPPSSDVLAALRGALRLDSDQSVSRLVALLGPPHAGHTTVLLRLAWDMADETRLNPASGRAIGVYVPLAGYEQGRGGNRLEQIIIQAVSDVIPSFGAELQQLFREAGNPDSQGSAHRYVFLLDGLDTIPESHRAAASSEIVQLFERLPDQSFVVSCTQDVFPASLFSQATVLLLQPMNERLILRYLRQRAPERAAVLFRRIMESNLLDVVTDPRMLARVYERLNRETPTILTRNQVLQDLLEESLSRFAPRYSQGDAALRTLTALAWEFQWRQTSTLALHDVFKLMGEIRQGRDYSLEDLYETFRQTWLLTEVGQNTVRFVHPPLQSYCAAIALYQRPDRAEFQQRLNDIIAMCGLQDRMEWWQDTIYALAGMLDKPDPLEELSNAAIRDQSSNHTLVVARSLKALSESAHRQMPDRLRQQLLDICVLRLRANLEPSPERRAQIASALGSLHYPKVVDELCRLLGERIRPTPDGWCYDLSNVRLAAARALRMLLTRTLELAPADAAAAADQAERNQVQAQWPEAAADQPAGMVKTDTTNHAPVFIERIDAPLRPLFQAWIRGTDKHAQEDVRAELRAALQSQQSSPLQQVVAAFALGDLACHVEDAQLLLDIISAPPGESELAHAEDIHEQADKRHERDETIWAAAEALTLFDARIVADLLVRFFAEDRPIPPQSTEQMIHVAGRVRVVDQTIRRWLFDLLMHSPSYSVKGRALQSLAWIGKTLQSLDWLSALLVSLDWLQGESTDIPVANHIIQSLALWDTAVLDRLQEKGMGNFTRSEEPDEQQLQAIHYLRLKAIEALALIGDAETLDAIYPHVPDWPLALRADWYLSARAIRIRHNIPM